MTLFDSNEFQVHENDREAVYSLAVFKAKFRIDKNGRVFSVSMGHLGTNQCIEHLKKLEKLVAFSTINRLLHSDWFGDRELCDLISHKELTGLVVSRSSRISIDGIKQIAKHKSITHLGFCECEIDDSCVDYILRMSQLEKLYIAGNNISNLAVREITKLNNLKVLNIRDLTLDRSTIEYLKMNMPDCRIISGD